MSKRSRAWLTRVLGRRSRLRHPKPLDAVHDQLAEAMSHVALCLPCELEAWATVVNYIAVAQRVMARCPPELIRDCALAMEVSARMPKAPSAE